MQVLKTSAEEEEKINIMKSAHSSSEEGTEKQPKPQQ
jgi:hypothetical protein